MVERAKGFLTWCTAAVLLVALMVGVGCIFYSAFGIGGYWTLLVGAGLVGLSAAGLLQLGGGGFTDGSLNDWRAQAFLAALVVWFVVVVATR
jgi:hypothetical protein